MRTTEARSGPATAVIVLEAPGPDGRTVRQVSRIPASAWTAGLRPGDQLSINADLDRAEVVQVLHVLPGGKQKEAS